MPSFEEMQHQLQEQQDQFASLSQSVAELMNRKIAADRLIQSQQTVLEAHEQKFNLLHGLLGMDQDADLEAILALSGSSR